MDLAEQQADPVDAPADVAAPAPAADDVESLLAEFDRAAQRNNAEPEAEPATDNNADATTFDEVDKFIESLDAPTADQRRISDLEGELNTARAAELDRQSRSDFEGFSKKLQAECGPNVDEHFARTNLLAMVAERPELESVWRYRNLTAEQRRAADMEFTRLERLYNQMQQAPDDPRKAEAMAQMMRRGQELGLMMNAPKILNTAWKDVLGRARAVKHPIDDELTAVHADVAAAVRYASTSKVPEEGMPDFANMDDRTFAEWTRKNVK
jgi:hypothetical protein